jgi:hypothetical protein
MTLNRDQLLDDLDALTEEQIEAGLAADVWGEAGAPPGATLRPQEEVRGEEAVRAPNRTLLLPLLAIR